MFSPVMLESLFCTQNVNVTLSFFVLFLRNMTGLRTTGNMMLWASGFHTAMVCLCGDDSLQIRTKELLHPQRVCDQDSWYWRSAADLVSAHLENSLCMLHHRYVQRVCCKPDTHNRQENKMKIQRIAHQTSMFQMSACMGHVVIFMFIMIFTLF